MPVTFLRRFSYGVIDSFIFSLVWFVMVAMTNVTPPAMTFMSAYTPQQYRDYLIATSIMTALMFALSIHMHWRYGGSIGKRMLGVRTVNSNGSPMTLRDSIRRALFCFGVSLLILWPGPITAAVFGERSDETALVMLAAGVLIWLACMSFHLIRGSGDSKGTLHERWLGLRSVRAGPVDARQP
jgi:uncharacterized RDD family membrane protein YckC